MATVFKKRNRNVIVMMIGLYGVTIVSCGVIAVMTMGPAAQAIAETPAIPPVEKPLRTLDGTAEFNPAIWLIGLPVIAVIILILVMAGKGGITKKVGVMTGWFGKLVAPTTGSYQSWLQPIKIAVALILVFILIAIFWPTLWEWLRGQKTFWLAVVVLPVIASVAAKYQWIWWLVIPVAIIGVTATDWSTAPNILDWRLPTLADASKASAEREAGRISATPATREASSEMRSETVVAVPGKFSKKMISIPAYRDFRLLPKGKVMVKTASGRQWEDWEGKDHNAERGLGLHDAMFQFMSLEEGEIEVTVEWEPK